MHKVLIGPQGQATLFCEAPDKFRAQQLAGKYAIALSPGAAQVTSP
jgi:hypothetical protein